MNFSLLKIQISQPPLRVGPSPLNPYTSTEQQLSSLLANDLRTVVFTVNEIGMEKSFIQQSVNQLHSRVAQTYNIVGICFYCEQDDLLCLGEAEA